MDQLIYAILIIILIILISYFLVKEGFAHYTSGGKQRFASQFSGTNQSAEGISMAAFGSSAMNDPVESFRAEAIQMTAGHGETYNRNLRKNHTRMENFARDDLASKIMESVLLNKNIGESGISGTEILLQNDLHGDLYNNYLA